MAKTNESFSLNASGMRVWWHGTTDSGFKHIYAPSFENPFFISDDPAEAEMYMHGGYDMDSSDSQLALVLINPDSLVTFDWCDQQDLDQIKSIPEIIKKVLAFKMKSTFSLIQGMTEMSLFYALGQDDFKSFSKWFKLWLEKINFAKVDDVKDEDAQEVWDWIGSARSSRDLFKIRDLTEDVDCETANGVLYELFWSQLEGTKFNSFHEREMSENIALCDASAIEGIWSRSLDMQEASDLMKSLRSTNLKSYAALRDAKTLKEAEAALKLILPPNPNKQSLTEDKELVEETSWWIRGDGASTPEAHPSTVNPLYVVNDLAHAAKYASDHHDTNGSRINIYEIALTKDNVKTKILDVTKAEDLEKIGYDKLLATVFSEVDLYFSWSMSSAFFNDRIFRPRELDVAFKFLLWKNGKANTSYKAQKTRKSTSKSINDVKKPKATLFKLISTKDTQFPEATSKDLDNQEFKAEYLLDGFDGNYDIMKLALGQLRLDIVNAYIRTFKTIHDKWDKKARAEQLDTGNAPKYNDQILQIMLQDIKAAGYQGYFCPELPFEDVDDFTTVRTNQGEKIDTIAILDEHVVKRVASFDSYDVKRAVEVLDPNASKTKTSLKSLVDLLTKMQIVQTSEAPSWWDAHISELGWGFAPNMKDAYIQIAKDPSKCLWHIWVDEDAKQAISKFFSVGPSFNMIKALDSNITSTEELAKTNFFQHLFKNEFKNNSSKFEKWLSCVRFEKWTKS